MILADTSVWIVHFRTGISEFIEKLSRLEIYIHPVVVGELAVGNLPRRQEFLKYLGALPCASVATVPESMKLLETHQLYGRGIGWGDLQLLVACRLSGCPLWTFDERLAEAARSIGCIY